MARTNAAKFRDGWRNATDAAIKIIDSTPTIGEFDKGEIIDQLFRQRKNAPLHPDQKQEIENPS